MEPILGRCFGVQGKSVHTPAYCPVPGKLHSKDNIKLFEWFQPFFRVESSASARQEQLQKGGIALFASGMGLHIA